MKRTAVTAELAEICKLSHLTPQELAQVLGASLVAVEQWAHGVTEPSCKQQTNISTILADLRQGRRLRVPTLVLQNGSFASRGSRRNHSCSGHADLFDPLTEATLAELPLSAVFSRLKNGMFLGAGEESLKRMLRDHTEAAVTPAEAIRLDVSAGKNTYTYDAHTYHTKVPPQGIVDVLRSYLPEGGLVLDPFSGSGMTGVAARIACMDVILNDLSPAACFIAHNFTESVSPSAFADTLRTVFSSLADLRASLYSTVCRECGRTVEIQYTVWSYRVVCPGCHHEFPLWNHCRQYGRTVREHKILKEFPCPVCRRTLVKRELVRTTAVPVLLGYRCCSGSQQEHPLAVEDLRRISEIDASPVLADGYYPTTAIPDGVNLNQPKRHGLTSIDQFYTRRNLAALSNLWRAIHHIPDLQLAAAAAFAFTSLYQRVTRLSEFRFWGGSGNTARFNVPFIFNEANVFVTLERKAASIIDHLQTTAVRYRGDKTIICHSATELSCLPDDSVDLIFTDPPFGANINYSEMNILWESWLGEFTDASDEAIVNRMQGKAVLDYENLMAASLAECYRVLRPGHWLLMVFMNSSSQVWDALRSAVRRAGFRTERLDIFDKQHGTFKQFVSEKTAGCDLILHCRKPSSRSEKPMDDIAEGRAQSLGEFLLSRKGGVPITRYLHVARQSEPDLRRLYSEWLSVNLLEQDAVIGFGEFRDAVLGFFADNEIEQE